MKHTAASRLSILSFVLSATAFATSLATGCNGEPSRTLPAADNPAAPETPPEPGRVAKRLTVDEKKAAQTGSGVGRGMAASPGAREATATPGSAEEPDQTSREQPPLKIKRLVVTHAIENREPASTDALVLGSPVYAFVELQNEGDSSESVVITFERKGAESVGHVELEIPGEMPRWRTWGKTALIHEAGTWSAVVKSKDGTELGRREFEVQDA